MKLSETERNSQKLKKIFKIEPPPKYIRDIIISNRLRYLKAHPKKKRKLENNEETFQNENEIQMVEEEVEQLHLPLPEDNLVKNNVNGSINEPVTTINTTTTNTINNDSHTIENELQKKIKQENELRKVTKENLEKEVDENDKKIQEIEKIIEDEREKNNKLKKDYNEITQKIEELKSRKRKMFEIIASNGRINEEKKIKTV